MAWLDVHKPVRDQWYAKRNRPLTGCTVLHTAESVMDNLGPDTGAEAVAEFIRTRTTPGSYHDLCDSDTAIELVDYNRGAYHDGTGSNNWALSISWACRTTDWAKMTPQKRRAFLRQGAIAFARQQGYRRLIGAPLTELRLITKAQSDRGESGFIYHGHRDPGRRSDPGTTASAPFPFAEFVAECLVVLRGAAPIPAPSLVLEDDMPFKPEDIQKLASDGVANRVITESGGKPIHTWEILRDLYHGQKAENAAMAALTKLVAEQNGLKLEDVRRVVSEEIAKGVDVEVTVTNGP